MRRVLAICVFYKIKQDDLVGNLFLDSGRDVKLIMAQMDGRNFKIAIPLKEALIEALIRLKIDVLIIDPFVKVHRIAENDNTLMDAVVTVFAEIADAANCAVELVQHTRKTGGQEITLEDARGASSVAAAARAARTLNRMCKEESLKAGVEEKDRRYHIRIDGAAKANLYRPEDATWFRLASIGLGNFGADPALDDEDHVQVAQPWKWPSAFENVDHSVLDQVRRQVAATPRRASRQADDWIGYLIIDVLGLNRQDPFAQAKAKEMFDQWLRNRMFKIVDMPNEKRKKVPFVTVENTD
jgi:hypothetical protein